MSEIIVRHSNRADLPEIRKICSGRESIAGTLQLPHASEALWEDRLFKPAPGVYSLVAEAEQLVVGVLTLTANQNPRRKHAGTFGMAVLDGLSGRGIGSALVAAAVDMAENWLSLSRLEVTAFTDNESAIALYKKFGFEVEGTAQRFAFRNGSFVDAVYMARIVLPE